MRDCNRYCELCQLEEHNLCDGSNCDCKWVQWRET